MMGREHWIETPLSNLLAALESGSRPRGGVKGISEGTPSIGAEHLASDGGFNFSNLRFVPIEFAKKMRRGVITEQDILIVKDGATTGKTSFVQNDFPYKFAFVNEHVFICRAFNELSKKYIFQYLRSHEGQNQIMSTFHGGAQGGINSEFVDAVTVPLPPLNEQKRIVEKLDAVLPKVKSTEARLAKIPGILKKFRQSVLTAACSGRLTEDWRDKKQDVAPIEIEQIDSYDPDDIFSSTSTMDLPEKWKFIKFSLTGNLKSGGTPSKGNNEYWGGAIPWVSAKDMKKNFINDSIDKITAKAVQKANAKLLPVNSLLFVVRGMILIHTFPVAVSKVELAINQDLKALIPNINFYSSFLLYYFKSQEQAILQRVKEASHGTRRLEMSTLENWAIATPPLPEQHEIVRRVEKLFSLADSLEAKYKKAMARIEKIEQAVLAKAFRGELVEPEPNDEPAEELLKRILAEKAKLEAGKKTRKKK